MNPKLKEQSIAIFESLEKWNALFELYEQTNQIMDYWLSIGAKALIAEFKSNPPSGWNCQQWDQPHEVRWHLTEFGLESIGVGFGWNTWEFHLHLRGANKDVQNRAGSLLREPEFQPLLAVFGSQDNTPPRFRAGSIACDVTFNPYNSGQTSPEHRRRELAWQAAHQTEDFVGRMSSIVRRITENSTLTALLRDLNLRAKCDTPATNAALQVE